LCLIFYSKKQRLHILRNTLSMSLDCTRVIVISRANFSAALLASGEPVPDGSLANITKTSMSSIFISWKIQPPGKLSVFSTFKRIGLHPEPYVPRPRGKYKYSKSWGKYGIQVPG